MSLRRSWRSSSTPRWSPSLAAVLVLAQHLIQRYEEAALNAAGQYCIDNLINRLLNE